MAEYQVAHELVKWTRTHHIHCILVINPRICQKPSSSLRKTMHGKVKFHIYQISSLQLLFVEFGLKFCGKANVKYIPEKKFKII